MAEGNLLASLSRAFQRLRQGPEQSSEPEWMDFGHHRRDVVVQNLGDLRRVNRILGGVRLTLRPLARLARDVPRQRPLRVLDIATGGADIPRAVARWAARDGRALWLVASDVNETFLAIARQHSAATPTVGMVTLRFVVADARRLPFVDGAFHVTTCSLALHHMLVDEAAAMLTEMGRCAALGVVVNDIVRGWLGYFGAYVATRLGSRNHLTWHDGPLSVLRAYTKGEMLELAARSGLLPLHWDGFLGYRVALTALPASGGLAGNGA
ncbi:MAG: methyltransferase domain-containing protein [Chloroflexota bacterium]|nr:methyltransferase domain-containing protein [Chloroflexota bacterium]